MKPWSRNEIAESVKSQMPEKRWLHTLGVIESAKVLAERYGADPVKADLAALMHDVAKFWPIEKQREWIVEYGLRSDVLDYDKELWHAPVGAEAAKRMYGIQDEEVLDAIRYHTSGREHMTLLDKVVCLADYIEPGRSFPGVEQIRLIAERSLEKSLAAAFGTTIQFLIGKEKRIYPLTVLARNGLLQPFPNE
ncbi:bis(5'-nucleosyl)-tetraphosphatase (symmetrical) YqeK [Paenibacillus turpanensis]|uniref:bis(5'-nucleosyl)-tetraphosphatase (symmetrical) YqeK n=1 Tax=Paenibacillus turpanensis TaxID=2689078 RepID=UPI00140BF655|nr:bis(5'-nucleosyl)-tetraphosphatase (symmetrical) YqeK [Paenibacillus turpanensis]